MCKALFSPLLCCVGVSFGTMKRLVLTIFIIIFLYQSYMSLKKYLAKNISLRIEKKVYIDNTFLAAKVAALEATIALVG